MVKKNLLVSNGTKNSNLNVKLDGAIPFGIMSLEQYDRYKKSEVVSTETTNIVYKEDDHELNILSTFIHPITKAKFNLVYNDSTNELLLIPDISLNVDMGIQNFDVIGYGIGATSVEAKYENFNYKKSIDTTHKIKLDKNKLSTLKSSIKIAILNIPGADYGNSSSRNYGHYSNDGDYTEYNTYPQAVIKIDFTDEILDETLPVNILTTYSLASDKIISNNFVLTENINKNIVFLSL